MSAKTKLDVWNIDYIEENNMLLKEVKYPRMNEAEWEEVSQEDLWEDGELKLGEVFDKINYHLLEEGDWKLIRKKED